MTTRKFTAAHLRPHTAALLSAALVLGVAAAAGAASAQPGGPSLPPSTLQPIGTGPGPTRVVLGQAPEPRYFGVNFGEVEPFLRYDVAAVSGLQDDPGFPRFTADLSYNGFQADGLLSHIDFFESAPDFDPLPNPDDPDAIFLQDVLIVTPDLTGLAPGDRVQTAITVADHASLFDPDPAQFDPNQAPFPPNQAGQPRFTRAFITQIVQTRALQGTAALGDPVSNDVGRHMFHQPIGQLTIDSGATGNDATTIRVNGTDDAAYALHDNGLLLQSTQTGDTVINDANDTATLDVFQFDLGAYDHTANGGFALPATNVAPDEQGGAPVGATRLAYGGHVVVSANYQHPFLSLTPRLDTTPTGGVSPIDFSEVEQADIDNRSIDRNPAANRVESTPGPAPATLTIIDGLSGATPTTYGLTPFPSELARRDNVLIEGEDLAGNTLDLSGVTISAKGASLDDRELFVAPAALGRVVTTNPAVSSTQTLQVAVTTEGEDDAATRLQLAPGSALNPTPTSLVTLSATIGSPLNFDDANDAALVDLQYQINGAIDLGVPQTDSLELGALIQTTENSGAGLPGQAVQTSLVTDLSFTLIDNNTVAAQDVVVIGLQAQTLAGVVTNPSVGVGFATDTHTDITVDTDFNLASTTGVPGAAPAFVQTEALNQANGRVVGEGLTAEVVDSAEYDVFAAFIQPGSLDAAPSAASSVGDGGAVGILNTVRDQDPLTIQSDIAILDFTITGSSLFSLSPAGGLGDVGIDQGVTEVGAGGAQQFTVGFDAASAQPGNFDEVYEAVAEFTLVDRIPDDVLSQLGFTGVFSPELYDAQTQTYTRSVTLREVVPGTGDDNSDDFNAGEVVDLSFDIAAGNINLTTAPLPNPTTVTIDVNPPGDIDPDGQAADGLGFLLCDVIDIDGLDGVLQVIQIQYDEAEFLSLDPTFNEAAASLVWFTQRPGEPDAWVNAVLGNSNVDSFNSETVTVDGEVFDIDVWLAQRRFLASYDDYLLANPDRPVLGDFGVDVDANVVWAVVDHNSMFAPTVAAPSVLPGDANADGVVDLLDFDVLAQNFGASTANGAANGDFNADGVVDLLDFDILAQNFGASSPSTIPEPTSLAILALAGAAGLRRRRV
ncbi:MAG: dockerin type I domain-containing protein [Planctomycetota bacterium]